LPTGGEHPDQPAGYNLSALYYLFEHMSMELIYLFTPSNNKQKVAYAHADAKCE